MKPFTKILMFCLLAFVGTNAMSQILPVLPDPDYANNHNAQITGTVTVSGDGTLVPGIVAHLSRVIPGSPATYIEVSAALSNASGQFTLTGRSGVNYIITYEYPTKGYTASSANPSAAFVASVGANTAPEGGLVLNKVANTITNCNVTVPRLTPFTGTDVSVTVNKAIPLNPAANPPVSVDVYSAAMVSNPSVVVSTTTSTEVQSLIIAANVKFLNPFGPPANISTVITSRTFNDILDQNYTDPIDLIQGEPLSYYDVTSAKATSTNIANFNPNYIGSGSITFPISATGFNTLTTTGGNTSSSAVTSALGGVCLVYTYSVNPLPVTLVSFKAKAEPELKNSVALDWATTQEKNSDFFDIERSSNAKEWSSIGKVSASSESSELQNYHFTDSAPKSMNYYRLKMVDKDGTYAYSRIETIKLDVDDVTVAVYPNPVSNVLFLKDIPAENIKQVAIINSNGQSVSQSNAISSTEGINVKELASGMYIVKISKTDGTLSTHKILIHH
ncbi:T9SS type A sorting domain-containing protein [Dyadobacter sp. 3J3]|uniref:T9SS type A sorting domain-containing protein n=1 Tax=Dyadobacter sp. 3J3 TaxID=2606600 RepID=UPI0013593141|nr:T9SS type A sorting domain-containing protein [Dyadobacter sp. 3J3]